MFFLMCKRIYVTAQIMQWMKQLTMEEISRRAQAKSDALYRYLDSSELFVAPVDREFRSRMNIVFVLRASSDKARVQSICEQAERAGFVGIAGHRSVGGFRVSAYNAITEQQVERFLDFLRALEAQAKSATQLQS